MRYLGTMGSLADSLHALNPYDLIDKESTDQPTPQDQAIVNALGLQVGALSPVGQQAAFGMLGVTPGGRALYVNRINTAIAVGAVGGVLLGAVGMWFYKKKR